MVYSAAKFQQSNTYQYPTDKKVRKLFEVPTYFVGMCTRLIWLRIGTNGPTYLFGRNVN